MMASQGPQAFTVPPIMDQCNRLSQTWSCETKSCGNDGQEGETQKTKFSLRKEGAGRNLGYSSIEILFYPCHQHSSHPATGLLEIHGSEKHTRIRLSGANILIQGSADSLLCLLLDVHLLELLSELKPFRTFLAFREKYLDALFFFYRSLCLFSWIYN